MKELSAWQELHVNPYRPPDGNRRASSQFTQSSHHAFTMSSIRLSRAALRARSAVAFRPVQRRGYADAVSDKIKLSLALPHSVCSRARVHIRCTCSPSDLHGYLLMLCPRLSTNPPMCTNLFHSLLDRIVLHEETGPRRLTKLQRASQSSSRVRRDGHPCATRTIN